jgi:hypothetical protein
MILSFFWEYYIVSQVNQYGGEQWSIALSIASTYVSLGPQYGIFANVIIDAWNELIAVRLFALFLMQLATNLTSA